MFPRVYCVLFDLAGLGLGHLGLHPALKFMKSLYDGKDLSFVANTGPLIKPLTAAQYKAKPQEAPRSVGSHNTFRKHVDTCDPRGLQLTGVLG